MKTEVSDPYNMFGKIILSLGLALCKYFSCPRLILGLSSFVFFALNYSLNYFWKKAGGILEITVKLNKAIAVVHVGGLLKGPARDVLEF